MTQRKKNNIIIGSLCAVVLLMVVGYAAFSSVLNIKGTSSISSNWSIKITKIEEKNIVGGASTALKEDGTKNITGINTLTASFETNLVSPGDSIEYDITVANEGTVNAKLDKITLSESNNPAIKFTSSGLEEGSELNAGGTAILTVKVEYLNSVTSQPDNTKGTLTVTLDYSQKEGSGAISQSATTVYSYDILTNANFGDESWERDNLIYSGDSLEKIKGYTEDYNSLGNSYFLKHRMNNELVESSEICFIKNGLHCIKPNEYELSQTTLLNIFGESACYIHVSTNINCNDGLLLVGASYDGDVDASSGSVGCGVRSDGSAYCFQY